MRTVDFFGAIAACFLASCGQFSKETNSSRRTSSENSSADGNKNSEHKNAGDVERVASSSSDPSNSSGSIRAISYQTCTRILERLHWSKIMKRKKAVSYEDGLHERLKDPEYAAEYLNAHLSEDEKAVETFLVALRDVAIAHGIANISKKTDLGRESLYKTLSKSGNPKIVTLASLLKIIGLRLSVEVKPAKMKRAS